MIGAISLDVVEALKSDWSPDLDPFVFTERDGYYLWSRDCRR
jgi:hypothetical protein